MPVEILVAHDIAGDVAGRFGIGDGPLALDGPFIERSEWAERRDIGQLLDARETQLLPVTEAYRPLATVELSLPG
ncbi:MAG: hypothetical protein ACT4O5_03645, partial [Gammaproteobacteria bacterium]